MILFNRISITWSIFPHSERDLLSILPKSTQFYEKVTCWNLWDSWSQICQPHAVIWFDFVGERTSLWCFYSRELSRNLPRALPFCFGSSSFHLRTVCRAVFKLGRIIKQWQAGGFSGTEGFWTRPRGQNRLYLLCSKAWRMWGRQKQSDLW